MLDEGRIRAPKASVQDLPSPREVHGLTEELLAQREDERY